MDCSDPDGHIRTVKYVTVLYRCFLQVVGKHYNFLRLVAKRPMFTLFTLFTQKRRALVSSWPEPSGQSAQIVSSPNGDPDSNLKLTCSALIVSKLGRSDPEQP